MGRSRVWRVLDRIPLDNSLSLLSLHTIVYMVLVKVTLFKCMVYIFGSFSS